MQFDGKDDYVDAGNGASLNITGDMTIGAWVKPSTYGSIRGIVGSKQGNNDATFPYRLAFSASGSVTFGLANGTTSYNATKVNTDTDQWMYVVGTVSGNSINVYLNGVAGKPATFVGTRQTTLNKVTIGSLDSAGCYFDGDIDEVQVYDRALTSEEISRRYIHSKYSSFIPTWSISGSEEQLALGVATQPIDNSTVFNTSTELNGRLLGFGGEGSVSAYFKYGLSQDNLNLATATRTFSDYGSFDQKIFDLSPNTEYYYQAVINNSDSSTAYGSILSFRTAAFDTDYYRTIINNDGSLTFLNKDTGETLLNNSPQYKLNYAAATTVDKTPFNSSFETDANSDDIPDGWIVDKTYIRLSNEQANNGTYSLKYNMASPDANQRRTYSPIIPIAPDKSYSIAMDSSYGDYVTGNSNTNGVIILYYDTPDGTGTAHATNTLASFPTLEGQWKNLSFNWVPPYGAKSFKLLFYVATSTVGTLYLDNLSIQEVTKTYQTNGGEIASSIHTLDSNITITSEDDTNSSVKVTNVYKLDLHSPQITYTATLDYKEDVAVDEERFDFSIPYLNAQVMTRDLTLTSYDKSKEYYSDLYTPKVVKFDNGLSFLSNDSMQSMRLRTMDGINAQLSFFSDYGYNHSYDHFADNNIDLVNVSSQTRKRNENYSASVAFFINPSSPSNCLVKTRQPYGYDGTLTFTDHADSATLAATSAVAMGTEDSLSSDYGLKGIIGNGLGWTKSVFRFQIPSNQYMTLEKTDFKNLIDNMYRLGVEIVPHSITPDTEDRSVLAEGLQYFKQNYSIRNWIDHSSSGNYEDLRGHGIVQGDPNYSLDLLNQYGILYAWSYIDFSPTTINLLSPERTNDNTSFFLR